VRTLAFLFGDQLSRDIPSLSGLDPARDVVLMAEVAEETTYVRHHKQKIVFILAAMRHFAEALRAEGFTVDYVRLDDPANSGSFTGELMRACARHVPDRIVVTEPGEWRVQTMVEGWAEMSGRPVEIREDDRFFCSEARFARWAAGRRSYRMEHFYREMRRETGLLMEDGAPAGGRWNFDEENRKPLPPRADVPDRERFAPDATTREVMALVARRFDDHFGEIEDFGWATDRAGARAAFDHFVKDCLPRFGDHQDAMRAGAPFLFHAVISPYLNVGLLSPREVCAAAVAEYAAGRAPLASVEGFVRQILGWREYVRGIYRLKMPDYAQTNALDARRPLPAFYWTGATAMRCIAETVADTRRFAYAHHIQRLMVTGNFALLAGVRPSEVEAWYLAVYADAFDWVELPNTHGMVAFADGGLLASKPYAASGSYIDRMSDYCGGCAYDPSVKVGPEACPFNLLYWRFLSVNRDRLGANPRLAMPYRTLDRMPPARRDRILAEAEAFLHGLGTGPEEPRGGQGDLFG